MIGFYRNRGLRPLTKSLLLLCFIALWSCNSDDQMDCFKRRGEVISKTEDLPYFNQIELSEGITLRVKEGSEQTVSVSTGKNYIEEIDLSVDQDVLTITDERNCQMLRSYTPVEVYITTPDLEQIYSASQYSVQSDGVLTFPNLTLVSGTIEETAASVFKMNIDNKQLKVQDNVSSVFELKGETEQLNIKFWGGNGRFNGDSLKVNQAEIYHRSTNDIIINPLDRIEGSINSTGNLVLKNTPSQIDVEELWTGHLIYP